MEKDQMSEENLTLLREEAYGRGDDKGKHGRSLYAMAILLIGALACNFVQAFYHYNQPTILLREEPSQYANLTFDQRTKYTYDSDYGPAGEKNRTNADALWESYAVGAGNVALRTQHAKAMGLPDSEEFIWDINRSTYFLAAYHSLHCLKKIRRSVVLSKRGEPQMDKYEHVVHCLDILRQDILCFADDTPLYTTAGSNPDIGKDQLRKCRDWSKLEAWAKQNEACYGYIEEVGEIKEIERFKYCQPGSKFGPNMRAYFGFSNDWYEEPVETVPPY